MVQGTLGVRTCDEDDSGEMFLLSSALSRVCDAYNAVGKRVLGERAELVRISRRDGPLGVLPSRITARPKAGKPQFWQLWE